MLRKRVKRGLTVLGLGTLLTVSTGVWAMAGAAAQAPVRPYTGQVREIKIHQCGLEPGACEGSLVLVQPGGEQVALAIPSRTAIQRGDRRVHLEEVGIGNYVTVQAKTLPSEALEWDESWAGVSAGERPFRLDETNGE